MSECVCLAPRWRSPEKVPANLKVWNVETLPLLPDPIVEEGQGDAYAKTDMVPHLCTVGKYVNGFNRFYASTAENIPFVTAGLTLFCRFHNDYQVESV